MTVNRHLMNTRSLEGLAACIANVPITRVDTGGTISHEVPFASVKERIDWLQDLLSFDTGGTGSINEPRRKALKQANSKIHEEHGGRPGQYDGNAVIDALEEIGDLGGMPIKTKTHPYQAQDGNDISLWRYTYEKISERCHIERVNGQREIIKNLAAILGAFPKYESTDCDSGTAEEECEACKERFNEFWDELQRLINAAPASPTDAYDLDRQGAKLLEALYTSYATSEGGY